MQYMHGGDIYTYEGMIDFSVNVNPFGPSKYILETTKKAVEKMGSYPDSRCRELRHAVSERLRLPEEDFIFGNGAAELIYLLVQAERPKKAVLSVPTFSEYEQALRSVDCRISFHFRQEANEFALTESYLDMLEDDVDMIFLCSPENPTGVLPDRKVLKKILRRCEEKNIRMVVDESFVEFTENERKASLRNLTSLHKNLFIIRAFTKMHAIPGIRLGYGICSDLGLLERMESSRQPWSVSIPAQAAGIAALKERQRVRTTRDFITRERKWMESQLDQIGIRYVKSKVNYLLLKSDLNLFEIMRGRQILIRDCSNYRGLGKGFYRIAIRQRGDNQKLLDILQEAAEWKRYEEERQGEAEQMAECLNILGDFCGVRDVPELTPQALQEGYGIEQADVMVLFGGSILCGADVLAEAMKNHAARKYMIVGGEGHTTEALRAKVHAEYPEIETEGLPEAKVFAGYLQKKYQQEVDYLETFSTNCGNNISYMLEVLRKNGISFRSIILVQDASMQRRMDAGLRREVSDETVIINYAAYSAEVLVEKPKDSLEDRFLYEYDENAGCDWTDYLAYREEIPGMWDLKEYAGLLMGEIPRLTDDDSGYGPEGQDFIAHVEIPEEVEEAYLELKNLHPELERRTIWQSQL